MQDLIEDPHSFKTLAIKSFRGGLNCAQSVLLPYAQKMDIEESTALSISCGFGAGMGRLQETCGAVTGAFMVISMFACRQYDNNSERKDNAYRMIQEFNRSFVKYHGSSRCMDLIKCNLLTPEGQRIAKESNVFETICEKCVGDAIDILEELISKTKAIE